MGSLRSDGSFIEQKRNSIRQIGRAFTESANRVESRTKVLGSGILGPQLDVDVAQTASQKIYECVKITRSTDDSMVARVCNSGLVDL